MRSRLKGAGCLLVPQIMRSTARVDPFLKNKASHLWNSLVFSGLDLDTVLVFKSRLKKYLFS